MNDTNELEIDIYKSLNKVLTNKVKAIENEGKTSNFKNVKNDTGRYEGKAVFKNEGGNRHIRITFQGQKMWTDEFGKGLGIGLIDGVDGIFDANNRERRNNNSIRSSFIRSEYWKQYTMRNPMRDSGRNDYVYITVGKKQKTIHYKNKYGNDVSYKRTVNKTIRQRDTNKKVRLYARPGGYIDLDGIPHGSSATRPFPLETPAQIKKKKQLSHGGTLRITKAFGVNFVTKTVFGKLLNQQEEKEFARLAGNAITKYLFK